MNTKLLTGICTAWQKRHRRRAILKALRTIDDFTSVSYYPDEERKSPEVIRKEIEELWVNQRGAWGLQGTIHDYFAAGYDRISCKIEDCVMQREVDLIRNARMHPYDHLLDNKEMALNYLHGMGIPTTKPEGWIDDKGMMRDGRGKEIAPFTEWLVKHGDAVFIKPFDGFQGRGAYRVRACRQDDKTLYYINDEEVSEEKLRDISRDHLVEKLIRQSASMNRLFPGAVNTLRILTISTDKGVECRMSQMMLGRGKSACSNRAQGGIVLGLDRDGVICTDGIMEQPPAHTHHPDTGVCFRGYRIPEFAACVDLAIRAHETLRWIYSIGWDIAVTDEGPLIVEGNADWGTAVMTFVGALNRKTFEDLFAPSPCR